MIDTMTIDELLQMNVLYFYDCAIIHDEFRVRLKRSSIDFLDLSLRNVAVVKTKNWYHIYMIQPTADGNKCTLIYQTFSEPRRVHMNDALNDIHHSITPLEQTNYDIYKLMSKI